MQNSAMRFLENLSHIKNEKPKEQEAIRAKMKLCLLNSKHM